MRAMDHDAKKAAAATAVAQGRRRRHDLLLVVSSSLVTLAVYKLALFVLQDQQVSIGRSRSGSNGSSSSGSSSSSRRMQMDVGATAAATSSQTPSTSMSLLSSLTASFLRGRFARKREEEEEEGKISWQWQQNVLQSNHSPVLGPLTYVGPTNDVWPVFAQLLSNQSVVYSFGSSCDTGWDFDLIDAFGVDVYAFDNTPESLNCLRELQQARSDDEEMSQTPSIRENLPAPAGATRRRRRPPPSWSHFPYRLAEKNGLVRVTAPERFVVAVDAAAMPGKGKRRQEKEQKKGQGEEWAGKEGRGASGASVKEGEGGRFGASGRREGEDEEGVVEETLELELPGRTLDSIMANFNAAKVDVMRIDMGGDELGILLAWTKKAVKLPVCQLLISFRGQHQMASKDKHQMASKDKHQMVSKDGEKVQQVVDAIQQSLGFLLVASAARTAAAKPHAPPSAIRYLFVNEGVCQP